jgi:hypothetical protein
LEDKRSITRIICVRLSPNDLGDYTNSQMGPNLTQVKKEPSGKLLHGMTGGGMLLQPDSGFGDHLFTKPGGAGQAGISVGVRKVKIGIVNAEEKGSRARNCPGAPAWSDVHGTALSTCIQWNTWNLKIQKMEGEKAQIFGKCLFAEKCGASGPP